MEKQKNVLMDFHKPKDPLGDIFNLQEKFGKKFCNFYTNDAVYKAVWCDIFSDCVEQEACELRDWLPWKHWKNYEDFKYNINEIRFEIIDMLHFVVSIALVENYTHKDFFTKGMGFELRHMPLYDCLEKSLLRLKGEAISIYMIDTSIEEGKSAITQEIIRTLRTHYHKPEKLLKIVLTLCAVWDMNAHDVYNYYRSKNAENHARQERGY